MSEVAVDNGRGGELSRLGKFSPLFAMSTVVGLALIEPAMGQLEKLGDTLEAKQYLFIMPTGEISYLLPAVRQIPVHTMGLLGAAMLLVGLIPAAARLRKKGLDGWSALGWFLVVTGFALLASEYRARGEWMLFRRFGVRYLAFTMIVIGSFLAFRYKRYLVTYGIAGFNWDLSSAVFWAALQRDPRATVPTGWYHHFDREEGRGGPCWLIGLVDLLGLTFFLWLAGNEFDPLRLFED